MNWLMFWTILVQIAIVGALLFVAAAVLSVIFHEFKK